MKYDTEQPSLESIKKSGALIILLFLQRVQETFLLQGLNISWRFIIFFIIHSLGIKIHFCKWKSIKSERKIWQMIANNQFYETFWKKKSFLFMTFPIFFFRSSFDSSFYESVATPPPFAIKSSTLKCKNISKWCFAAVHRRLLIIVG